MKIKVERCWGNYFRLTTPCGNRELIPYEEGESWSRKYATQALNMFMSVYGFKRSSIRFEHLN